MTTTRCRLPDASTNSASLPESRRSALDAKIRWHYEQIALLKAERNSIAYISSLPNEVLSMILNTYAQNGNSLSDLKWTKIMLVCRLWHDITMMSHSLWGDINLERDRPLSRMHIQLNRSGTAPLKIRILSYETSFHFSYIQHNAHRVQTLDLSCEELNFYSLMLNLPSVTFPRLRTLSLVGLTNDSSILPGSIFEGGMPSLTELNLSMVPAGGEYFKNEYLGSLVTPHEYLVEIVQYRSNLPTFDALLWMLRSCPRLKHLELTSCTPSPNPQRDYGVVKLSHLTAFRLVDGVTECTALLDHLRFPGTTRLSVQPYGLGTNANLPDILIPLGQHIRASTAPRATLLRINCRADPDGAHLITSAHSSTALVPLAPDTICLLDAHPYNDDALLTILEDLSDTFSFDTVTHLDLHDAPRLETAGFNTLLPLLPALEMLYLSTDEGGLEFMHRLCDLEHQEPSLRTAYPRLQRLGVSVKDDVDHDSEVFVALKHFLEALQATGDALRGLEVEEDGLQCLDEQELRIVGSIIPLLPLGVSVNGVVYNASTWGAEVERREADRRMFDRGHGDI
ncbi:hypothetical protein C8R43DRAFT_961174 [Mycena crocata]|nr:hypothetical protein C8R43DRAFT_961174 [Mycena crocata]